MALNQAKAQIEDLKQRSGPPQYAPSPAAFFPRRRSGRIRSAQSAPAPRRHVLGFLHQAATTAAGVIAGDLAFEALGSLFAIAADFLWRRRWILSAAAALCPLGDHRQQLLRRPKRRGRDDSQFAAAADRSGDDMSPTSKTTGVGMEIRVATRSTAAATTDRVHPTYEAPSAYSVR